MRVMTIVAIGIGLAAAGQSWRLQAATNTVPATAQFSDRAGDHIKSDGRGAYVDGLDGVISHFFTTVGEQDWVQYHTSQKPGRTVVFVPEPVSGSPSVGAVLNAEKPIINFDDLAAVTSCDTADGTCVLDSAVFDTSVGKFRFDGVSSCQVHAIGNGNGTWTVSTASDCNWARLIRTRQVKGKTIEEPVGQYALPFQVTVSLKN